MRIVEMTSTIKVSVPMPDEAPPYEVVLFDKARKAFALAMKDNGTPVHVEIESLELSEVKTVSGQKPEGLEVVRLIINEWLKLKPDAELYGYGVEKAIGAVLRRFGYVMLTRQAYEELTGHLRQIPATCYIGESIFTDILDWRSRHRDDIFCAVKNVLLGLGYVVMDVEEWWEYDDEPMSQIEDSRQAAEMPVVR